jgi:hypothetical protein
MQKSQKNNNKNLIIMKKFLSLSVLCSIIIACSSTPSESSKKEAPLIISMIETVDMLYSGNIAEDDVVYFIDDLRKVLGEEQDGWAAVGYWKYRDGHFHTYTIDESVLKSEYNPYVLLTLTDTPQPVQIKIEMSQEDGKWMINDILGIEYGEISYAFSDFISVAIAEAEAANNPYGEH